MAVTLPDLADVSCAEVERGIRRRLRREPDSDPAEVAMGIIGPVLDAKDRRYERLRGAAVEDSAT